LVGVEVGDLAAIWSVRRRRPARIGVGEAARSASELRRRPAQIGVAEAAWSASELLRRPAQIDVAEAVWSASERRRRGDSGGAPPDARCTGRHALLGILLLVHRSKVIRVGPGGSLLDGGGILTGCKVARVEIGIDLAEMGAGAGGNLGEVS